MCLSIKLCLAKLCCLVVERSWNCDADRRQEKTFGQSPVASGTTSRSSSGVTSTWGAASSWPRGTSCIWPARRKRENECVCTHLPVKYSLGLAITEPRKSPSREQPHQRWFLTQFASGCYANANKKPPFSRRFSIICFNVVPSRRLQTQPPRLCNRLWQMCSLLTVMCNYDLSHMSQYKTTISHFSGSREAFLLLQATQSWSHFIIWNISNTYSLSWIVFFITEVAECYSLKQTHDLNSKETNESTFFFLYFDLSAAPAIMWSHRRNTEKQSH